MTDRYASYQFLQFDRPSDRVLRITINRPEKLNALPWEAHGELARVWHDVDSDTDTNVAIIRGAGKAFSAGGDFGMVERLSQDYARQTEALREFRDLCYNIVNCSKPIVSAIHGVAVGAGLAAALMADISIVAKSARLIDGHTRLGLAAGDHAAMIWPLLCGMAKAKYHVLLCEAVNGEEAERIGLVSLCVADEELTAKSEEVAARLATGAQRPIRWSKYAMNNWLRMAGPIFDNSAALELLTFNGPEVQEGLASLKEKRPPKFDYKV
ncbi:MAG TPA: enoyl-CoA hydratase/isomerase family protein [Casimicrobiaceae bacterium]|nr:enoyl-CoA hydratase/isomerase family protein [Casimicrobiaceae bacterium]